MSAASFRALRKVSWAEVGAIGVVESVSLGASDAVSRKMSW